MRPLFDLPEGAAVLVDSAPIIYVLEGHPTWADSYRPLFTAEAAGQTRVIVSTVTMAEVLGGPLRVGNEVLAARYRHMMTGAPGWCCVDLTPEIAEQAARVRVRHGLKLPDAIQVATALASEAHALVTHDRDFSRITEIPVLSVL